MEMAGKGLPMEAMRTLSPSTEVMKGCAWIKEKFTAFSIRGRHIMKLICHSIWTCRTVNVGLGRRFWSPLWLQRYGSQQWVVQGKKPGGGASVSY